MDVLLLNKQTKKGGRKKLYSDEIFDQAEQTKITSVKRSVLKKRRRKTAGEKKRREKKMTVGLLNLFAASRVKNLQANIWGDPSLSLSLQEDRVCHG